MSELIILRGNSACGKSSTAKLLQEHLGEGVLLVPQDVVRRDMLRVKDTVGSVSTDLLDTIVRFGMERCRYVILEGILTNRKHGDMLRGLITDFENHVHPYYFKIPFEETLRRHQFKDVDFGEEEMRQWFLEDNRLGVSCEKIIDESLVQDDIIQMILSNVR